MIGYTAQPHETVNYIDKHDNETLWDNTQTKLPAGFSMDERIRVHMLSNAFVNYGQGVPFYQLGSDILRSKSLDRNSYNSGDWYNAVDFTLETNNWAIGLPPGRDNSINWQAHHKFLSNPNIKIEKKHKERAQNLFREQLNIRYSSPLFRLETAEQVHKRLTYHNTGPDQTPGIIAMSISDGACTGQDLDPDLDGIIVVFNGANKTQTIGLDMKMKGFELHPLQKQGLDEMVKKVVVQNGEIRIPALTAAVLIKPQGSEQGEFICNPWLGSVKEPGATIYFKKPGSWGQKIYLTARDQQEKMKQSGSPMPALGQGWYSKQLPDGVYKATVTFRDDKGHAIRNIAADGDGCYPADGSSWKKLANCELPGIDVAFKKPPGWDETVNVYTFSPENNGGWPGEPMSKVEGDWYYYRFEDGIFATDIIFNDGAGNQTSDLFRRGSGCFAQSKWQETCPVLMNLNKTDATK